jgi:hypothetical protein
MHLILQMLFHKTVLSPDGFLARHSLPA